MTVMDERHVLHVLLVENDRMLCRLVELIVKKEGWNVTSTPDGHTAIDVLRTDLPDVLLLDLMLPGTTGFDVLEWIEETNPSWLPHVIVCTAASTKVIADLERRHTVCRILRKPFDITELVNSIAICAEAAGTGETRETGREIRETRQ